MSCSTTTSVCFPGERLSSSRGAHAFRRPSCRRPARRRAATCGSCVSNMPISSHCFWPCDSWPGAPVGFGRQLDRVEHFVDAIARGGVEPGTKRAARHACPPCARVRDSRNRVVGEYGRLSGICGRCRCRSISGSVKRRRSIVCPKNAVRRVGSRPAGDHIHDRGLARAVGADDGAQLAGVDDQRQIVRWP